MRLAYRRKGGTIGFGGKLILPVGAEKSKIVIPAEVIPESLQVYGTFTITLIPENGDHFSKSAHSSTSLCCRFDQLANKSFKSEGLRLPIVHKQTKSFSSIEWGVLSRSF